MSDFDNFIGYKQSRQRYPPLNQPSGW